MVEIPSFCKSRYIACLVVSWARVKHATTECLKKPKGKTHLIMFYLSCLALYCMRYHPNRVEVPSVSREDSVHGMGS